MIRENIRNIAICLTDQLIGIRCLKNRCDGIPAMNISVPRRDSEQMEIVVAEKALSSS